mmetsp:Transcript_21639/g.51697  ORF Transcript_21639/g.51697 Transcript_21639/m.51697 type:complete len:609 (-) Transcript_21639:893-2719(-)
MALGLLLVDLHGRGLPGLLPLLRVLLLPLRGRRQHRRGRPSDSRRGCRRQGRRVREKGRPGVAGEVELDHLQVLVQADERCWLEAEGDEVRQRIPVPVLHEDRQAHGRRHLELPVVRAEADRDIPPARVEDPRGQDGAHLAQGVLMLVVDHLVEVPPERGDLLLRLLHLDEGHPEHSPLPHEIRGVRQHRLEQRHGLPHPRPGAGDRNGHGRAVAHVRVVRLGEEADDGRALVRRRREHKAEAHDRRAAHVVADVADGKVKELLDGRVVGCPRVGHADHKHPPVAQDRVLVVRHLLHNGIRHFLPAKHDESEANGEASDDLLVLSVVRIVQHLHALLRGAPGLEQAHGDAGSLPRDRRVGVEDALDVFKELLIAGAHPRKAETEAPAVLDAFVVGLPQAVEQESPDVLAVVGVDEPEGIQRAALRVRRGDPMAREVRLHERLPLRQVPLVDDAEPRGDGELCPVGGPGKPLEVLPEERVDGRPAVHQRVGHDRRAVANAVARFNRRLDVLQNLQVAVVVRVQELQVQVDGRLPGDDAPEALKALLVLRNLGSVLRRRPGLRGLTCRLCLHVLGPVRGRGCALLGRGRLRRSSGGDGPHVGLHLKPHLH